MSIRRLLTTTALAALVSWLAGASAQAAPTFQNVINFGDPTFNQLLGINDSGLISGYFGSGAPGHPNMGYTVPSTALSSFTSLNFPGSVQTQVTGLNNTGTFVGFFATTNSGVGSDSNFGWYEQGGLFHEVNYPTTPSTTSSFNQLLGVNNSNVAVGFFVDATGASHGYTYNIGAGSFSSPINDPSAGIGGSTTTSAINNAGDIVGFWNLAGQPTISNGFLDVGGTFTTLNAPGASSTMLLGINNNGLIVGTDTDAAGNQHGVIYNELTHSWTVLDAFGLTSNFTTFNGVNDLGQIVGFYTQDFGNGNTIGLLVSPAPEAGKGVLGLALLVLALAMRKSGIRFFA
jgi:hypothetical protein